MLQPWGLAADRTKVAWSFQSNIYAPQKFSVPQPCIPWKLGPPICTEDAEGACEGMYLSLVPAREKHVVLSLDKEHQHPSAPLISLVLPYPFQPSELWLKEGSNATQTSFAKTIPVDEGIKQTTHKFLSKTSSSFLVRPLGDMISWL